MHNSAIHDWIKSATSIVQSVALAAGIFFAVAQYKTNSEDAANKEIERRQAAAQATIAIVDSARASIEEIMSIKFDVVQSDSSEKKNAVIDKFVDDTKVFRIASDRINTGIIVGTM
jgi:hypothetical protein